MRAFLAGAAVLSVLCVITIMALSLSGARPGVRTLLPMVGVMTLCIIPLVIAGLRRRMERGRRVGFGLGVNIVDIAEAIMGRELSRDTQFKVQAIAAGLAVVLLAVGVAVAVMTQS